MRKILTYGILSIIISVLPGCSEDKQEPAEEQIVNVLKDNLRAAMQEDIELIKETTHPDNPSYEAVVSFSEKIFDRYDLSYQLVDYKITGIGEEEAEVSFTQITKKINGPEFRDNRITGVHTLRKDSGNWKIYNTKVDKIEYL